MLIFYRALQRNITAAPYLFLLESTITNHSSGINLETASLGFDLVLLLIGFIMAHTATKKTVLIK